MQDLEELAKFMRTDIRNVKSYIRSTRRPRTSNPIEMEARIDRIPGVLTVGIFAERPADILPVGGDDGVREMRV